jgi:hypothetical protein
MCEREPVRGIGGVNGEDSVPRGMKKKNKIYEIWKTKFLEKM